MTVSKSPPTSGNSEIMTRTRRLKRVRWSPSQSETVCELSASELQLREAGGKIFGRQGAAGGPGWGVVAQRSGWNQASAYLLSDLGELFKLCASVSAWRRWGSRRTCPCGRDYHDDPWRALSSQHGAAPAGIGWFFPDDDVALPLRDPHSHSPPPAR